MVSTALPQRPLYSQERLYIDAKITAAAHQIHDPEKPLEYPLSTLTNDLNINTVSVLAAIQQATEGFDKLPSTVAKNFFYTGNILNTIVNPPWLTLGIGKAASAYLIKYAVKASENQKKEWK